MLTSYRQLETSHKDLISSQNDYEDYKQQIELL